METPILLIIFRRPDTTQRVFDEIRKQKPKYLFVAADGARPNVAGEAEKCQATRDIIKQVDWDCELKLLLQDKNLGVKDNPATAISWFFEHVEQGIILEDDCLPHPSFFGFCAELLDKYKDEKSIMMISGDNFLPSEFAGDESYHFSKYSHSWGWATWKRVWSQYDIEIKKWPEYRTSEHFSKIADSSGFKTYWTKIFDDVYTKKFNTAWDYQFLFLCWLNDGLCIAPNVNLITNIGFGAGGSNTFDPDNPFNNMPTTEMKFPLAHPSKIERNVAADTWEDWHVFPARIL